MAYVHTCEAEPDEPCPQCQHESDRVLLGQGVFPVRVNRDILRELEDPVPLNRKQKRAAAAKAKGKGRRV